MPSHKDTKRNGAKEYKVFFRKAIDKTDFVVYNSVSENANRLTC